jgi:hypothetical protein
MKKSGVRTFCLVAAFLAAFGGVVGSYGASAKEIAVSPSTVLASGRGQELRQLLKQLNLSTEQKGRIKAILKNAKPQIEAIRSNSSLSPLQKQAQAAALQDSVVPQIKSVLTPEQIARVNHMIDSQIDNANFNSFSYLSLTTQQKIKIKIIISGAKAKRSAITSNASLSSASREEQMTAVRANAVKSIADLLTSSQKELWKQHH